MRQLQDSVESSVGIPHYCERYVAWFRCGGPATIRSGRPVGSATDSLRSCRHSTSAVRALSNRNRHKGGRHPRPSRRCADVAVECRIDPMRRCGPESNRSVANRQGARFHPVPAAVSMGCAAECAARHQSLPSRGFWIGTNAPLCLRGNCSSAPSRPDLAGLDSGGEPDESE